MRSTARPSTTAVALVVAVGAAAAFLLLWRDVVSRGFLSTHDPSALVRVVRLRPADALEQARWVTALGAPVGVVVVGVVGAVVLRRRGARWAAAVAPVAGAVVAGAGATAVKAWTVPVRPPSGLRLPFEQDPTFPSGHTAAATALYVGLGLAVAATCRSRHAARFAVVAGAATASLVGASRLVLAVHWPTDVFGGWALGTAVAVAGWVATTRLGRRRRTRGPAGDQRAVVGIQPPA